MSERKMSAKGFLHKTTTKAAASAAAFIAQHREWLETGELASLTSPILRKLDDKEILPTPALNAIKDVVVGHMIASEIRKGEEAMARREEQGNAKPKNWTATIYNAKGEVVSVSRINDEGKEEIKDLTQSFDQSQEADRWTDRRLVEGAPDWYGVVQHSTLTNKDGEPLTCIILRGDALARVLRAPKGPAMRKTGGSTSRMSFGVKAQQDRAHFSRG